VSATPPPRHPKTLVSMIRKQSMSSTRSPPVRGGQLPNVSVTSVKPQTPITPLHLTHSAQSIPSPSQSPISTADSHSSPNIFGSDLVQSEINTTTQNRHSYRRSMLPHTLFRQKDGDAFAFAYSHGPSPHLVYESWAPDPKPLITFNFDTDDAIENTIESNVRNAISSPIGPQIGQHVAEQTHKLDQMGSVNNRAIDEMDGARVCVGGGSGGSPANNVSGVGRNFAGLRSTQSTHTLHNSKIEVKSSKITPMISEPHISVSRNVPTFPPPPPSNRPHGIRIENTAQKSYESPKREIETLSTSSDSRTAMQPASPSHHSELQQTSFHHSFTLGFAEMSGDGMEKRTPGSWISKKMKLKK
jgi:hypothetical protein